MSQVLSVPDTGPALLRGRSLTRKSEQGNSLRLTWPLSGRAVESQELPARVRLLRLWHDNLLLSSIADGASDSFFFL